MLPIPYRKVNIYDNTRRAPKCGAGGNSGECAHLGILTNECVWKSISIILVECPALLASGSEPAAIVRCLSGTSLYIYIDRRSVATFAKAAKVHVGSLAVVYNPLDWPLGDKVNIRGHAYGEI